ncbi:RICIN domain-containing protein [Dactylosporangium sp. NPDC000555]|uniref:RICIN domain-containing protein n=1 Tax=Dactylosporangium sp. NPDC000555 TaxID=3154260 RepID=UPI00332B11A2
MSVAEDGKDAGEAGGLPHDASSRVRHRVPHTASAAAPVLPEPFIPAKPAIPAIPHQRRPDGPTAVATASIPEVRADDLDVPDSATVASLPGEVRMDAFADAAVSQPLEFIVSLPGVTNDPDLLPASADIASPAAVSSAPAAIEADPETPEEVETVEGELMPLHTVPADDSPTLADYAPPAFAIVAEEDPEDADDYLGTRRRVAPWRRYPVGALAVAVLILLITGAVAFQWISSGDSGGSHNNGLPPTLPGVTMPETPAPAAGGADPSPSASTTPTPSPTPSRSRTGSPAASRSASAPSSVPASSSSAPPSVVQPIPGRMLGKQSQKCVAYRSGQRNVIVLENCDARADNQRWRVQGNPATGAFLVTDNGLCMDVQSAGTGNGNAVWAYGCNGTPAQKWVRHANNTWENPNSRRCLDANAGTGAGTPLVIWDCRAADSQIWTLG